VITFIDASREEWEHALRSVGLGGASTHIIQTFKNKVFSAEI